MTTVDLKMIEKMLDGSYHGQKRKLLNSNPESSTPYGEDGSTPEFLHNGFWPQTVDGNIDRLDEGTTDGVGQLRAGKLMHRGGDRSSKPSTPEDLSKSVNALIQTSPSGDESEYQTLHGLNLHAGLDLSHLRCSVY